MSTFRHAYRPLTAVEKQLVESIKDKAEELELLFELALQGREIALARTKLEETVMWAVKGITG